MCTLKELETDSVRIKCASLCEKSMHFACTKPIEEPGIAPEGGDDVTCELFLDACAISMTAEMLTNFTNPEVLFDSATPQYRAMDWVLNVDPLKLASVFVEDEVMLRMDRFLLSVLWFSTTNSGNWTNRTGWLTEEHECDWFGVVCGEMMNPDSSGDGMGDGMGDGSGDGMVNPDDMADGMGGGVGDGMTDPADLMDGTTGSDQRSRKVVTGLLLDGNNLDGKLPDQIHLFSSLETLHLENNNLTGSLPETVGWITPLKYLYVSNNTLSGALPETIGNLADLEELHLDFNEFSGKMPQAICSLDKLQDDFGINFKNSLPNLECDCCDEMDESNELPEIPDSDAMVDPDSLKSMCTLKELETDSVRIKCASLCEKSMHFACTKPIEEPGIAPEGGDDVTCELFLDACAISMTAEMLTNFTNPEVLFDSATPQYRAMDWVLNVDPLKLHLKNESSIEKIMDIDINQCGYNITIEEDEKYWKKRLTNRYLLTVLWFNTNGELWTNHSGWLMNEHECDWFGVECNCRKCQLAPTGLVLSGNGLDGSIPNEIGHFLFLETLQFDKNRLVGSLPDSIGETPFMRYLHVNNNTLNGTIPESIGNLVDLEELQLGFNLFSGMTPESICNISALQRDFGMDFYYSLPNVQCDCCNEMIYSEKVNIISANMGIYPGAGLSIDDAPTGKVTVKFDNALNIHMQVMMDGLDTNCTQSSDKSKGCGVYIHVGETCDDANDIGEHYWNPGKFCRDPWENIRYELSNISKISSVCRWDDETIEKCVPTDAKCEGYSGTVSETACRENVQESGGCSDECEFNNVMSTCVSKGFCTYYDCYLKGYRLCHKSANNNVPLTKDECLGVTIPQDWSSEMETEAKQKDIYCPDGNDEIDEVDGNLLSFTVVDNEIPEMQGGNGYTLGKNRGHVIVVYNENGDGISCGILN